MKDLPSGNPDLLGKLLGYQLKRQAGSDSTRAKASELATQLVKIAFDPTLRPPAAAPVRWLRDALVGAEFLAREVRT
jgi:hypothetical protein